jgi:heat shock protein HtpX
MNAFATGRDPDHSSIAVTTGLLKVLNRQELEGVIAHEMSHIGNYDIRFGMMVAVLVGLIAIISHIFLRSMWYGGSHRSDDNRGSGGAIIIIAGIALAIVAPIVVRLVQLAISRRREYLADSTVAMLTRYPEGLASALEKIGKHNKGNMPVSEAVSHIFFVDTVHTFLDNLTATHPPIDERVKKLRAM